jgi:hypothetical protein
LTLATLAESTVASDSLSQHVGGTTILWTILGCTTLTVAQGTIATGTGSHSVGATTVRWTVRGCSTLTFAGAPTSIVSPKLVIPIEPSRNAQSNIEIFFIAILLSKRGYGICTLQTPL